MDATLLRRDVLTSGLDLQLKVTNGFDADELQPGVRDADAGMGPEAFDARGSWVGSEGFYSSRLPPPGRAFMVVLRLRPPGSQPVGMDSRCRMVGGSQACHVHPGSEHSVDPTMREQ